MFAKRLVNQLSASDDSESSMISKLKVYSILISVLIDVSSDHLIFPASVRVRVHSQAAAHVHRHGAQQGLERPFPRPPQSIRGAREYTYTFIFTLKHELQKCTRSSRVFHHGAEQWVLAVPADLHDCDSCRGAKL